MNRFQTRLFIGFLLVTLFVLTTLGLIVGQLVASYYKDTLTERLERELTLSAAVLETLERNEWESFLKELSTRLDVQVQMNIQEEALIVDPEEGIVSTFPEEQEDLLLLVESFWNDTGSLQFALPVEQQLEDFHRHMWIFIFISFSLAFFIIAMMSYRITLELTRPISHVTNVANELAKGNFKVRTYDRRKDEIGQLMRSMNMLAYNLDQITTHSQL